MIGNIIFSLLIVSGVIIAGILLVGGHDKLSPPVLPVTAEQTNG